MKSITFLAIFMAISSYYTALSTTIPWYMKDVPHMNHKWYKANCTTIRYRQYARTFIKQAYYLTVTQKSTDIALEKIDAELEVISDKFVNKQNRAIQKIKEKYDLDDDHFGKHLEAINMINKLNIFMLKQDTVDPRRHDENLPQAVKEITCTLLKKNGINPLNVKLLALDEKEIDLGLQGQAILAMNTTKENPFSHTIKLTRNYVNEYHALSNCAHEVEHLLQQHMMTDLFVTEYLQKHRNISSENLETCTAYKKLKKSQEQQAEIFAALRDPDVAYAMTKERRDYEYPGYLYEKHYYYLTTIHMLWTLRSYIASVQTHGTFKATKEHLNTLMERLIS